MRAVIQRVTHASVTINGNVKSAIQKGFLILLGVCDEDTMEDVDWLVKKIANLRVFDDENGVMNRSILDLQGEALVVSQFTLFASYKKGNRPSWFRAGSHEHSIPLYEAFCRDLSDAIGKPVGTGEFGADTCKARPWWSVSSHSLPVTRRATVPRGSELALTSTLSHSTRPSAAIYPMSSGNP